MMHIAWPCQSYGVGGTSLNNVFISSSTKGLFIEPYKIYFSIQYWSCTCHKPCLVQSPCQLERWTHTLAHSAGRTQQYVDHQTGLLVGYHGW